VSNPPSCASGPQARIPIRSVVGNLSRNSAAVAFHFLSFSLTRQTRDIFKLDGTRGTFPSLVSCLSELNSTTMPNKFEQMKIIIKKQSKYFFSPSFSQLENFEDFFQK
jgi:hypothetical protein